MKLFSLWISVVIIHATVAAQTWDIRLENGRELQNITPKTVTSDSLVFLSTRGQYGAVPLSGINEVTYREKESRSGRGLVIGLLSGAAVGYVSGLIIDGNNENPGVYSGGKGGKTDYKVALPLGLGIVGGIVGYAVGNGEGKRSVDVASLNDQEKSTRLSSLLSHGTITRGPSPAEQTTAGTSQQDVLYLKNGSMIRGSLVEWIPDSTVKVVTTDSSVFVFRASEVDKFVKGSPAMAPIQPETAPAPSDLRQTGHVGSPAEPQPLRFGLNIGVAVPTGEFGSTSSSSGGYAKSGVMFGGELEYRPEEGASYLASLSMAFDGVDMNTGGASADIDSWLTIWPMVGIRFYPPMASSTELYLQGKVGLLFGTYPGINISSGTESVSEPSASASSLAFSVGAGIVVVHRVNIGVYYLQGNPEYELKAVWTQGGSSTTQIGKIKQSTGIVQVSAGVVF